MRELKNNVEQASSLSSVLTKTIAIIAISAICTVRSFAQTADEIKSTGVRASHALLKRIHRHPDRDIQFNDTFGLYGLLRFAESSNNQELIEKVKKEMEVYRTGKRHVRSGHIEDSTLGILASELFRLTKDESYLSIITRTANFLLENPQKSGLYKNARMWTEDMYLIGSTLSRAYQATGNKDYIDFAAKNLSLYLKELQQEDGSLLYRTFKEGKEGLMEQTSLGNALGFLGLTEVLNVLPKNNALHSELLNGYKKLLSLRMKGTPLDEFNNGSAITGIYIYGMQVGLKNGLITGSEYNTAISTDYSTLLKNVTPGDISDDPYIYISQHGIVKNALPLFITQSKFEISPECSVIGQGSFLLASSAILDLNSQTKNSIVPDTNLVAGITYQAEQYKPVKVDYNYGDIGKRLSAINLEMEIPANIANLRAEDMYEIGEIFAKAAKEGNKNAMDKGAKIIRQYVLELQLPNGFFKQASNGQKCSISKSSGMTAVGLTKMFSVLPKNHPVRPWLNNSLKKLARGLERTQDSSGLWHQNVDNWSSEYDITASAQFTYALAVSLENIVVQRIEFRDMLKSTIENLAKISHNANSADAIQLARNAFDSYKQSSAFSAPEDMKKILAPMHDLNAWEYQEKLADGRSVKHISIYGSVVLHIGENHSATRFLDTASIIAEIGNIPESQKKAMPAGGVSVWIKDNPSVYTTTDDLGFYILTMPYVTFKTIGKSNPEIMYQVPNQQPVVYSKKNRAGKGKILVKTLKSGTYKYIDEGLPKGASDFNGKHKLCGDLLKYNRKVRKDLQAMLGASPKIITLSAGEEMHPVYLSGQIVSSENNQAIEEVSVWLKRNPFVMHRTAKDGAFEIMGKEIVLYLHERDSLMLTAPGFTPTEIPISSYMKNNIIIKMNPMQKPVIISNGAMSMVRMPSGFLRMGKGAKQEANHGKIGDFDIKNCWPIQTVYLPSFEFSQYHADANLIYDVFMWAKKNGYNCKYVGWFNFALFCNALSEREGFNPCYYTCDGKVVRSTTLVNENLICDWKSNGYRIPTYAEHEYACFAGRTTKMYWGEDGTRFFDFHQDFYEKTDEFYNGLKEKRHSHGRGLKYETLGNRNYNKSWRFLPKGIQSPLDYGIYESCPEISRLESAWDLRFYLADDSYHPKGPNKREYRFIESIRQGTKSLLMRYGFCVQDSHDGVEALYGWDYLKEAKVPFGFYGFHSIAGNDMSRFLFPTATRLARTIENINSNTKLIKTKKDTLGDLPQPVKSGIITENIKMSQIPKGSFEMGGIPYGNNPGGGSAEFMKTKGLYTTNFRSIPSRMIKINSFKMSSFEITVGQWNKVYDWAITNGYDDIAKGSIGEDASSKDERHPIVNVTWYDVLKWCNAASEKEGLKPCYNIDGKIFKSGNNENVECDWNANGYRLPTEAEWEYAALGGQHSSYHFGDGWQIMNNYGWLNAGRVRFPLYFSGNANSSGDSEGKSHIVGGKIGNQFGLYDTLGNVWEWCWDYTVPYDMLEDKCDNPKSSSLQELNEYIKGHKQYSKSKPQKLRIGDRCVRGLSYDSLQDCSASIGCYGIWHRGGATPENKEKNIGFRIVKNND